MHLSHSQITMFLKCPVQWRYRYIDKFKIPPPGPMAFGIAFDEGLTGNYEPKIQTEKDLSAKDVTDLFDVSFGKFRDTADWQGLKPADLQETGRGLTVLHMKEHAPTIMPISVQEKVEVKFCDDFTVKTVSDIVTRSGVIIDIKTAGKSPSKNDDGTYKLSVEHFWQSLIYTHAFKAKNGRDPFAVNFIYHVKNKKPVIRTASRITTPAEEAFILNQYKIVFQAIEIAKKANCFIPNRTNMMCTQKQCGYWSICHEEFGPTLTVNNEIKAESFVA